MNNIQISSQATTVYIFKQVSKNFSNYSKLLVQFSNTSKDTPDYIYCAIHGSTSITPVKAHLIVYGVKEWSDSVDPSVYDNWYTINNGDLEINTNNNMGGNTIKNLKSPVSSQDAINKAYLEANFISKNGGEIKSELSMGAKRITNLASPRFDYDAANAKYVDDNYVQLSGASNDLSMNNHRITNLGYATNMYDSINKKFIVDNNSNVFLHGKVDDKCYFVVNEVFRVILFDVAELRIKFVPNKNKGRDTLRIKYDLRTSEHLYNFQHNNLDNYGILITTPQRFSLIYHVRLEYGRNIPFMLYYKCLSLI